MTAEPLDHLVWSYEHDAWWAPAEWGYVKELWSAGWFTKTRALEIEQRANAHGKINERAVPILALVHRFIAP